MAVLTADAVWIQDAWRLRRVELPPVHRIDVRADGRELLLTPVSAPSAEKLTLTFEGAGVGQRWSEEVQALHRVGPDEPPADRPVPEGVALVRRAPDVPHVAVGRLEFTDRSAWAADRALQLRAGMRGADAVIQVERERRPDLGWGARCVRGLAVRIEDPAGRQWLRTRYYGEQVCGLVKRSFLLLVVLAALLFVSAVFCTGMTRFNPATGETVPEAVASAGPALGLLFAWPLVALGLAWAWRWPPALRAAGLAVLAATTGRGATLWLAHLVAVQTTGTPPAEAKLWMLADPVEWAIAIIGAVLCARAWRLAGDARQILPQEFLADSTARKTWSRLLLAATGVYTVALVGFVGYHRYQFSAYLLQPGVDPRREHEALLALNEGVDLLKKGDLEAADRSLQRSLRLWEELTTRRPAPAVYRANLAITLSDLGLIRQRQGRVDEAETYYSRAVALADELADNTELSDQFRQSMADIRAALAELRSGDQSKRLADKDQAAARKYEEAQVKAANGDLEAERLYGEAIALWEEVLPQVDNPEYRKSALAQLALASLHVAELQERQGKRSEAEETLKAAIARGQEAVALDPDRPLVRNNLEVARRKLDELREQTLQEKIDKLCGEQRFADAAAQFLRSIEDQEEQVRLAADHDAAVRRLAYRLDRFASFLAHCPDAAVRDSREAVKRARRATELRPDAADFWYTLAMVQYRNGDWRDSLTSLETRKTRAGAFDALDWLLVAMNRCQLKQRDEARAALRMAVEWIQEQQRKAEGNPQIRFQYEMMRPSIDALRREAEDLIQGKDGAGDRVG
jgi:tetratricopeptide (TPR) repeat protein